MWNVLCLARQHIRRRRLSSHNARMKAAGRRTIKDVSRFSRCWQSRFCSVAANLTFAFFYFFLSGK